MRTNKRQVRIKGAGYVAMIDRTFCEGAEPRNFIDRIDDLMAAGEILKDGRTCRISRLAWNGTEVVAKCYNHKGLVHSLRHTIKGSRARKTWLHAHRLGVLEVATPKALAYIERRKGPILWSSYSVTE